MAMTVKRIWTSDPLVPTRGPSRDCSLLIFEVLTVYKFFYSDSKGCLKNGPISFKKLVSAEGIESA
jgi:hypothetical protein